MCKPETTQSYIVLKAFKVANRPILLEELKNEIEIISQKAGFDGFSSSGPLSLGQILTELDLGEMTETFPGPSQSLSPDGETLKLMLEVYVEKSYPRLVAI